MGYPIIWLVSRERKATKRKQSYGYCRFSHTLAKTKKKTKRKQNNGATIAISLSHRTTLRVILNGEHRAKPNEGSFLRSKIYLRFCEEWGSRHPYVESGRAARSYSASLRGKNKVLASNVCVDTPNIDTCSG